jgi:transposase-like protein
MPQLQLPVFPPGSTPINNDMCFIRKKETITYIYGNLPVFQHHVNDLQTFRMIISQFYVNGSAKQADLCRAFGISKISVKRSVKLYREKGPKGFYEERRRRGPAVLTEEVLAKAQQILEEGKTVSDVSQTLGLKRDTVDKAVRAGRLKKK